MKNKKTLAKQFDSNLKGKNQSFFKKRFKFILFLQSKLFRDE